MLRITPQTFQNLVLNTIYSNNAIKVEHLHKKGILILVVSLVAIVALSLFTWNLFSQIPQKYEKNITRNFENSEEQTALTEAESIDYSTITSLERFSGTINPEDYLNSNSDISYTSANFIDSHVINYYQTRYENQQGKEFPRQIELNYEANASMFSHFLIFNSPAPEGVTWHNVTIVMSASNGTIEFTSGNMQFFYKNQTNYQVTKWDYDFNFSDCYVINMKLRYSEIYAPVAGFFVSIHQIVVLDKNFEPVLIGLESGMAVS